MSESLRAKLEYQPEKDPETVWVSLESLDSALLGKQAELILEVKTEVKDSSPVHGTKEAFRKRFPVERSHRLAIPKASFQHYSYGGSQIDIEIHIKLKVDDSLLFDTKVSSEQKLAILARPLLKGDASSIVEPKDAFSWRKNLQAIPADARLKVFILLIVGGILILVNSAIGIHDQFSPEHETLLYSHRDSDGDGQLPAGNAAGVDALIGAGVWFAIRRQLRRYMTFKKGRVPAEIRPGMRVNVAELVQGVSRVRLDGARFRVVAGNFECGQYVRGSGSNRRTVSFRTPVRAIVLFEQKIDLPAGIPIESHIRGELDFADMFENLYPPQMISKSHGLDLEWELQLIHNELIDQELKLERSCFQYMDFLCRPEQKKEQEESEFSFDLV